MKLIQAAPVVLVAALGGCSMFQQAPTPSTPSMPVTKVMPYYTGTGQVQRVMPSPTEQAINRLEIKMDDGRVQYVDTEAYFAQGARVQLTEDRLIRRM